MSDLNNIGRPLFKKQTGSGHDARMTIHNPYWRKGSAIPSCGLMRPAVLYRLVNELQASSIFKLPRAITMHHDVEDCKSCRADPEVIHLVQPSIFVILIQYASVD